ncbi:hypothetical protein C8F01DRAFT_1261807 [Mycena amicta]|nr:hypothetical protein C8F01DRAFT_1261807 [Mycena amicta]
MSTFRRSAHLLDDPSSPLPPPNPHFTGTGTCASLHSVYSGQSAHTTVAEYNPYPYGAGLNASVPPAVAVASPVAVMYTHDTHPSFAQPPPAEYYGYSSATPVPSPGPGYAPAPMQGQGYSPVRQPTASAQPLEPLPIAMLARIQLHSTYEHCERR